MGETISTICYVSFNHLFCPCWPLIMFTLKSKFNFELQTNTRIHFLCVLQFSLMQTSVKEMVEGYMANICKDRVEVKMSNACLCWNLNLKFKVRIIYVYDTYT
jgi:hypothetical protein